MTDQDTEPEKVLQFIQCMCTVLCCGGGATNEAEYFIIYIYIYIYIAKHIIV